ncbi:TPA: sugar phosphate isomerase/epimerase [Candidatus Poribacteria bacterium]|nr:sugar phosphate isomerase/epimerase [Candidatus Poribacteria bacterium]
MARIPVALQLYTVRDETAKDFLGTLERVAQIGYEGVEFAGTGGLSSSELKKALDELGLKPAGSHVGIDQLKGNLDAVIEYNLEIGNRYVVCPFMPEEMRGSASQWREVAETLSEIGAKCKEEGLILCYHNHAFEFRRFNGKYGLDILYESSDPEFLKAEIDTFWVKFGGEEPAEYIRKLAGRCPLIHLKDMGEDGKTFMEVGEGIMDFMAIFDASEKSGVQWYIVEQDVCQRPSLESARISFENLRKWGKV